MRSGFFDIHNSVILSRLFSKFDTSASRSSFFFKFFQNLFLKSDAFLLNLYDNKFIRESVILSSILSMEKYFGHLLILLYSIMMVIPDDRWKNVYMIPIVMLFFGLYLFTAKRRDNGIVRSGLGFDGFDFSFLIFQIFFVLSAFLSKRFEISISYLVLTFILFLWAFFVINYFINEQDLARLVGGIAFSTVLQSVAAIFFMMFLMKEVNLHYFDPDLTLGFRDRLHGSFGNPNVLAEFLVIQFPFLFAVILNSKSKMRYLWVLGLIPIFYVIVKTGSRAAWMATLFAIAVFFVMKKPKSVILLFFLGIGLLFVVPDSVYVRFMSIFNSQDKSMGYRWKIYDSTWNMILKNPLGIGLGSGVYQNMLKDYKVFGLRHIAHSHNIFLQVFAEQGIFGLISFVALILSMTVKSFFYNSEEDALVNNIMLAAFAGFMGILVIGITEHIWFYYRIQIALWTDLCILFICFRLKKSRRETSFTEKILNENNEMNKV